VIFIKNKNSGMAKKAFTIIELLVVMAVVVMLFAVGLGGMITSQRQFVFLTAYNQVLLIVRDQRSLALAGKALPDYTDYDKDLLKTTDLVTPANYGVSFEFISATNTWTVTTFADLHKGIDPAQTEGLYDAPGALYTYTPGRDLMMSKYTLDKRLSLVSNLFKFTAPLNTRVDLFYSPIFGDVTIKPDLGTKKFLIFGVADAQAGRKKCSKIHPVAGVPETAVDADCLNAT
jgi:prepilin-type N-terminal cleavage/methylation domain-containing protein